MTPEQIAEIKAMCADRDYSTELIGNYARSSWLPALIDEVARLRDGLNAIGPTCERLTRGSCLEPHSGRTRDCEYTADRWCDGCIAADALGVDPDRTKQ
jgi:hypothetical protein